MVQTIPDGGDLLNPIRPGLLPAVSGRLYINWFGADSGWNNASDSA